MRVVRRTVVAEKDIDNAQGNDSGDRCWWPEPAFAGADPAPIHAILGKGKDVRVHEFVLHRRVADHDPLQEGEPGRSDVLRRQIDRQTCDAGNQA